MLGGGGVLSLAAGPVVARQSSDEASTGDVRADTVQLGATQAVPDWHRERSDGALGRLTVIDSPERLESARREHPRLRAALGDRASEMRRVAVEAFLEDTDFGASTLLVLETVGPDACYDALEVANVRVEQGRLAACAAAVDTCEDGVAAQALTFPAALLRATVEGGVPAAASVTFVDDRGRSGTACASADDPLPSDGDPAASDDER